MKNTESGQGLAPKTKPQHQSASKLQTLTPKATSNASVYSCRVSPRCNDTAPSVSRFNYDPSRTGSSNLSRTASTASRNSRNITSRQGGKLNDLTEYGLQQKSPEELRYKSTQAALVSNRNRVASSALKFSTPDPKAAIDRPLVPNSKHSTSQRYNSKTKVNPALQKAPQRNIPTQEIRRSGIPANNVEQKSISSCQEQL